MELDDEVCLCFHVTKRKVLAYLRIEKPRRVAQLSDCYGAGTGCGWCRTYLRQLFEAAQRGDVDAQPGPSSAEYSSGRRVHIASGKGTPPPGAEPNGVAPD